MVGNAPELTQMHSVKGTEDSSEIKLIDSKNDISLKELKHKKNIGITAGASAPQVLLDQVVNYLVENGATMDSVKQDIIIEDITFSIPKELREL